jgi:alpha-L-rhamnosidase
MLRRLTFALVLLHVVARPVFSAESDTTSLRVVDLRCEYLTDPLGIDDVQPRLSWKLAAAQKDVRGKSQSAYHVLVASKRSLLDQNQGDLWDTGKIISDQSHLVRYGGKRLRARMVCWWKVRVWDESGKATTWSPTGHWSMGVLTPEEWEDAQWIGLDEDDDPGVETTDIRQANWLWYPEGNATVDAPVATRYFRRRIVLPGDRRITNAWCFFAGDDRPTPGRSQ